MKDVWERTVSKEQHIQDLEAALRELACAMSVVQPLKKWQANALFQAYKILEE